jgi:hypothetical protein
MYIRLKEQFRRTPSDSKWKRISYAAYANMGNSRDCYEIKDQPPQSPAQLEALALGRAIRHAHAAVAQSKLALQYLNDLPPRLKANMVSMIVQEEDKHFPTAYKDFGGTRASISLANQFASGALTSLKQLTKKGAALKK